MKSFRYRFRIPFHEVDAAGIMFHAHLFSHAHEAYAALMREMGLDLKFLLEEGRYLIPLVHVEADFRLPMALDDEIEVTMRATPPGRSSFGFHYTFHREGLLCATAITRHLLLNRTSHKPVPLLSELKQKLQEPED